MLVDLDLLFAATKFAGFCVACFAALLSLSRGDSVRGGQVLTLLFLTLALSEASSVIETVVRGMPVALEHILRILSFVVTFFIAPLFLFHVKVVTGSVRDPWHWSLLGRHFVFPFVAVLVGVSFLLLPASVRVGMYSGIQFTSLPPSAQLIALALIALEFLIYTQWLIYVAWVCRAQILHIGALKQHFASTEGLELRWVTAIAVVLGLYATLSLLGFVLNFIGLVDPVSRELDSSFVLLVISILALWGLRPSIWLEETSRTFSDSAANAPAKYQKSALAHDDADRIARKLVGAMKNDRLFRDPTLTLSALSKHIGVSTNYVSQTLNEHLGQSFFEFVNGWRVEEAIPLVEDGNQTVLAIAYEVGFNSRSSFYTAFKKKTGLTPSAYKSKVSPSRSVAL